MTTQTFATAKRLYEAAGKAYTQADVYAGLATHVDSLIVKLKLRSSDHPHDDLMRDTLTNEVRRLWELHDELFETYDALLDEIDPEWIDKL
jgi:hypothetical protein